MIEINIDPATIEREVVKAIVASALGPAIAKAVREALTPSTYGQKSPLQKAVEECVYQTVVATVHNEPYSAQIADAVRAAVEAEGIRTLADAAVENLIERMRKP